MARVSECLEKLATELTETEQVYRTGTCLARESLPILSVISVSSVADLRLAAQQAYCLTPGVGSFALLMRAPAIFWQVPLGT
jgi:hypothetical protein